MNKLQWYLLSIVSTLGMMWFIKLDSFYWGCMNMLFGTPSNHVMDFADVWCIINGEIYEPFIYLLFGLGTVFLLLAFLEKGK